MAMHATVDLAVAFEGGVHRSALGVYLSEWCAVTDREGHQTIGGGSKILLPPSAVRQLDAGSELGDVFDSLVGRSGTGAAEGAYGILTAGLIHRADVDAQALLLALARYLRPDLFGMRSPPSSIADALTSALRKRSDRKPRASAPLHEQLELLLLH
jgi:non-canonical (house-cleaning) NTP pyrophosphatase